VSHPHPAANWSHPRVARRTAIQAGAVGLLGLGTNHLTALRSEAAPTTEAPVAGSARSVIYIFLSGGLGQHDSFDPKPDAPDDIRGEFRPIGTSVPGLSICEHLPRLAERARLWSVVRSLGHPYNEHSQGHMVMLSGRTPMPPTFRAEKPMAEDWPSIAALVGDRLAARRNNLPPAIVLPDRNVHRTGRTIPGQFAGQMGPRRDPWFLEAVPFNGTTYGAFPEYEFHHATGKQHLADLRFQAPSLTLPHELTEPRLHVRRRLLESLEGQRAELDRAAGTVSFDRYRQGAFSLLTDPRIREAFDVTRAPDAVQDRYGRNSFGWSLLMARRLVERGVGLIQVNLGNNETWDTHGNAFPHLKDFLFPPTDRALSALLDDLHESGLLESTLIVMAGEFGRTPRVFGLPQHYRLPGRDHWGAVQSVFFAGGGVQGGRAVGSSDKIGAYPAADPQRPEDFAATIYSTLGIPPEAAWTDATGRPHHLYHGDPIRGLFA
jgi:hypothetical protein